MILDLMEGADKVGIDCPPGWPDALVQFVIIHHNDALAPARRSDQPSVANVAVLSAHRRTCARHAVDDPLSVSSVRIGMTAIRAARLYATDG